MKTKEIDAWIEKDITKQDKGYFTLANSQELSEEYESEMIKVKLIIPVEPEVVEFVSVIKEGISTDQEAGPYPYSQIAWFQCVEMARKLVGRKWRIVATEVVE